MTTQTAWPGAKLDNCLTRIQLRLAACLKAMPVKELLALDEIIAEYQGLRPGLADTQKMADVILAQLAIFAEATRQEQAAA